MTKIANEGLTRSD